MNREPEGVVLHDNASGQLVSLNRLECVVSVNGEARTAVLRVGRGVLLAPKPEESA